MNVASDITAQVLRARIAEAGLPKYVVGATCRINPIKLSRLLNERLPLTPELGERILAAIKTLEVAGHGH